MRNAFSAAMGGNLSLHCCLGSAFCLQCVVRGTYPPFPPSPFSEQCLRNYISLCRKMKCSSQFQKKKKKASKKHISQQTLPSSSHMASDSRLAGMRSAPSVFWEVLYILRKAHGQSCLCWDLYCANRKRGDGIVTAFQRRLVFSILFYPEALTFLLSASLKGRSTTMSCLYHLVYGLYVAQSSARNLVSFYCLVLHSACDVLIIRVWQSTYFLS